MSTLSAVELRAAYLSADPYWFGAQHILAFGGTGLIRHESTVDQKHIRIAKEPLSVVHPDSRYLKAMLKEIKIYHHIEAHPHPFIMRMLGANQARFTLYLPVMVNGNLLEYLETYKSTIVSCQRLKWCYQAASAVTHLHHIGVHHCDLNLGNFLLDDNLDLKLCDFAGSTMECERPQNTAAPRWVPGSLSVHQEWNELALTRLDIFTLAVGFYVIQAGSEPFPEYNSATVKDLYQRFIFPDTSAVPMGEVIRACWEQRLTDMDEVLLATIANIPLPL